MVFDLWQWPSAVYPKEADKLARHIRPDLDAALLELARQGAEPQGFDVKLLGKRLDYLWQMNLKIRRDQIRVLYAPWRQEAIILYCIHPKTSPQEQLRAYERAQQRKREAEAILNHDGPSGLFKITLR